MEAFGRLLRKGSRNKGQPKAAESNRVHVDAAKFGRLEQTAGCEQGKATRTSSERPLHMQREVDKRLNACAGSACPHIGHGGQHGLPVGGAKRHRKP